MLNRILAHWRDARLRWRLRELTPAQWFSIGLLSVLGVVAFGIAPETSVDLPVQKVEQMLSSPQIALLEENEATYWREERIQRGDTLGSVLARLQVSDSAASHYLRTEQETRALYQLRPGKAIRVKTDEQGGLLSLRYLTQQGESLQVERRDGKLNTTVEPAVWDTRIAMRSGEIKTSLFGAADEVGMPDPITLQLAEIFSGDIDFYHDLRRGDRFAVVYEVLYLEGERVKTGRILAAEFINKGTPYRAVYYQDGQGLGGYYAPDGKSMRKAFLRSPMEFSRITSGFSLARLHPIWKTWRAHRGVDYAAPIGTPVRATGDGKVELLGRQGGYGNLIVLKHHGAYSTAYAHLSRFASGLKKGSVVKQGELIGYVGMTGWATGPHLHYEFRINGEQRDPLRVALPQAVPIAPQEKMRFAAHADQLLARLELTRGLFIAYSE